MFLDWLFWKSLNFRGEIHKRTLASLVWTWSLSYEVLGHLLFYGDTQPRVTQISLQTYHNSQWEPRPLASSQLPVSQDTGQAEKNLKLPVHVVLQCIYSCLCAFTVHARQCSFFRE